MLMTKDELTGLQQAMLDVLIEADKPLSRAEIADLIGRPNRLVPYDVEMLEAMVEMGVVHKTVEKIGTVKTVMKYQATN